jgi:uncharacterized protein YkwD
VHPRGVLTVACIAALSLTGCPGSSATGSGAGNGRVGAVATGPGYRASASADFAPPAALSAYFASAVEGGARAQLQLVADRGLSDTATLVAQRVASQPQHLAPSARAVQSLAWSAGVLDPQPALSLVTANADVPASAVAEAIARDAAGQGYNRVGVASVTASDGTRVVAVVLSQRRVSFAGDVPRRAATGARVQLRGQLSAGYTVPEIAITDPSGRGERFGLGEGPEFVAQFPTRSRGAWQVELLATGPGGTTVIANFPVYVDVDPPSAIDENAQRANETPAQVADRLLARINEARRARSRTPVQLMPTLSLAAAAHSEDMARNRYFAHNDQAGHTPGDRVAAAGIRSGIVLENIGRGSSSDELHHGLMGSPGHRANIENERVTHVGIGVVPDPGAAGGFIVTQNFIEVAAAVDTAAGPQRIVDRVNQNRQRNGVAALVTRPELMQIAARAAQSFFSASVPTQQRVVEQANRDASRGGLMFRRIETLATIVTNLEDATGLEPLLNYEVSGVGIGVAQGTRAGVAPNSIFVVYILGYPR